MASQPYYKQNRLKQLRAFCFLGGESSISRAAEQLVAPALKFIEIRAHAAAGKLSVASGG